MAFATVDINDGHVLERSHDADVILRSWVARSQLAAVAATPGENLPALVDGGGVVVSQRDLDNHMRLQVCDLPGHWLFAGVEVTQTPELPVTPSVDNTVLRDRAGVVIASADEVWEMSLFFVLMFDERIRLDLMRDLQVLVDCRGGAWPSSRTAR